MNDKLNEKLEPNYQEIPLDQSQVNSFSNIVTAPGGSVVTGGDLRSPNFVKGFSGWQLDSAGNIEANSGTFRTGVTIAGYVVTTKGAFGGNGADGALSISSGTTTISTASANVLVKNYSSISITGTGALAFSNPASDGSTVILKSQGDVTLTSSATPMIDCSGLGANGGAADTIGSDVGNLLDSSAHGGQSGSGGSTGGSQYARGLYAYNSNYVNIAKMRYIVGGAGGGGGSLAGAGGTGGRGGGALSIECAGAWNFTTAGGISVAGANGVAGTGGRAGGGGGGGGMTTIFYNTLTANTGTITVSGGTGGAGSGGAGGGGGGSINAAGSAGPGATGGVGADGLATVMLNEVFA